MKKFAKNSTLRSLFTARLYFRRNIYIKKNTDPKICLLRSAFPPLALPALLERCPCKTMIKNVVYVNQKLK